jgi:hypothetical protein
MISIFRFGSFLSISVLWCAFFFLSWALHRIWCVLFLLTLFFFSLYGILIVAFGMLLLPAWRGFDD